MRFAGNHRVGVAKPHAIAQGSVELNPRKHRPVGNLRVVFGCEQAIELLGIELGRDFGAGLSEAEVTYLRDVEWAQTADDILWRRSKLGLRMSADGVAALEAYLTAR